MRARGSETFIKAFLPSRPRPIHTIFQRTKRIVMTALTCLFTSTTTGPWFSFSQGGNVALAAGGQLMKH